MLKFTLKYHTFAPTCFGPPGPSSAVLYCGSMCFKLWCLYWVPCSVRLARCTALSTNTTAWNTCCHNTTQLITMYVYWLLLQKCNFSQAQYKLFCFLDRAFSIMKTKINQQNAQINSGLIYYWSITPTCFSPSVEAIIREFEILESYKAIVLIC